LNSGWECTFNEIAKKRGPPKGYIDSLEDRLKKMEKLLENIAQTGNATATAALRNGFGQDDADSNDANMPQASPEEPLVTEPLISEQLESKPVPVKSDQMVLPESDQKPSSDNVSKDYTSLGGCGATVPDGTKVCKYIGGSVGLHLLGSTEEKSERTFGTKKMYFPNEYAAQTASGEITDGGVFVVRDQYDFEHARDLENAQLDMQSALPPKDLVELLIKTYFDEAMVICPIIDKQEFMDSFEQRTSPAPSRMLLNAMFCVACRHLHADHPVLKRHNLDPKRLFKLFTDRSAVAFTRQYFSPNVSSIQAVLLVTSNPNYTPHGNPNWIWSGMAIRMAQDIGFHRCNGSFKVSPAQEDFAKRLWWSAYISDRWTCAMLGRPLGISDADVDTEKPEPKNEADETFVHFIKLSEIVGEVLRRLYSAKSKAIGYGKKEVENVVEFLRGMLNDWRRQLPERLNISDLELASMRSNFSSDITPDKTYCDKGPFMMYYFSVVILLNRPFIVSGKNGNDNEATRCCTEAAKTIMDVARYVRVDDIMHFGHTAAMTIMQASFIHLYNSVKTTAEISAEAHKYLEVALKVFRAIWSRWPDAPPVVNLIAKLQTSIEKIYTKKDSNVASSSSSASSEGHLTPDTAQYDMSLQAMNQNEAPSPLTSKAPGLAKQAPDESMFANWPIEQFVASLSDATIGYDKMLSDNDIIQKCTIPFWGAPSGYDWQEWGNFLVENGVNTGATESIM